MYYNSYFPQMQRPQNLEQQFTPYNQNYQPNFQQTYPQNPQTYPQASLGLQGKLVDSIDVVKALDIPLDGSISYFPLADGSLIVTRQLQKDGTSKTIMYKPIEQESDNKVLSYITSAEFEQKLAEKTENYAEIKDEMKNLKRQIRDLSEEIRRLKGKEDEDESY